MKHAILRIFHEQFFLTLYVTQHVVQYFVGVNVALVMKLIQLSPK